MTDAPSIYPSRIKPVSQFMNQLTGEYSAPGIMPTDLTGTLALVADELTIFPFFNPTKIGLTDVGVICSTGAASSTVRMAMFHWDYVLKEIASLKTDYGTPVGSEAGDQGWIGYTGLAEKLEAGWYAFAVVSGGTPTLKIPQGVSLQSGNEITISTTTMNQAAHFTADGTGMVAGGITDPGDRAALTAANLTSGLVRQALVARYAANPA